jgi:hypothetical protein
LRSENFRKGRDGPPDRPNGRLGETTLPTQPGGQAM